MNITVHIDEERLKQKKEKPSAKSRRALHRKTLFFPKLKHLIEFSNTIFKIHENHEVFRMSWFQRTLLFTVQLISDVR